MTDVRELVDLVTWFLLAISLLATMARVSVKWSNMKFLNMDDVCAIAALMLNIGAGTAVSIAATHGLGLSIPQDSTEAQAIQKNLYAANILYILTVAFAKLSIIYLLRIIFVGASQQRLTLVLGVFIAIQGLAFTLVAILPCRRPNVWALGSDQCVNLVAFWRTVGVMHIITDIALVLVPCILLSSLRMSLKRKTIVSMCFSVRIIDIATSAVQLAYTDTLAADAFITSSWPWYLISQVTQTVTIISSSVPYLQQLLTLIPSGMLTSDEMRRRGILPRDELYGFSLTDGSAYILRETKLDSVKSGTVEGEQEITDSQGTKRPSS